MTAEIMNRNVWLWYAASVILVSGGAIVASQTYPGGFDWIYQVISALASTKHNPLGGRYFAGSLVIGMACLGPVWWSLTRRAAQSGTCWESRWTKSLGLGIIAGCLVGLERLFIYHLSDVFDKAHEALAALSFLCLYAGTLGIAFERARSKRYAYSRWIAWAITAPLLAIGVSQLALYLDQRDLGWVDRSWRDMGIPLWLSFAFWQWLATGALWIGIGLLLLGRKRDPH